ncbi:hypothetical protein UPYG_G00105100 [Umbra pygmaea]|uniref:THD domain-containing protein n=1 Tax=Umbra pygmaea TaxID=75934 RepID=A0ABD0X2P4_UMBPY
MAEHGVPYPSVFMVDTHAAYPPLPPKLRPHDRRRSVAQTMLFLLVALAFFGLAIEACFIYHLYSTKGNAESGSAALSIQDEEDITDILPTERPNPVVLPSKPVAHLTAAPQAGREDGVIEWNMEDQPLLHGIIYNKGKLVIQKEGYYYIYSKVFFSEADVPFMHSVCKTTPRYSEIHPLSLLQSRRYHPKSGRNIVTSNSYLGGVFHFFENDSIFVKVVNISQIRISLATENVFGIYMI